MTEADWLQQIIAPLQLHWYMFSHRRREQFYLQRE
jgi:hypothetical protein